MKGFKNENKNQAKLKEKQKLGKKERNTQWKLSFYSIECRKEKNQDMTQSDSNLNSLELICAPTMCIVHETTVLTTPGWFITRGVCNGNSALHALTFCLSPQTQQSTLLLCNIDKKCHLICVKVLLCVCICVCVSANEDKWRREWKIKH